MIIVTCEGPLRNLPGSKTHATMLAVAPRIETNLPTTTAQHQSSALTTTSPHLLPCSWNYSTTLPTMSRSGGGDVDKSQWPRLSMGSAASGHHKRRHSTILTQLLEEQVARGPEALFNDLGIETDMEDALGDDVEQSTEDDISSVCWPPMVSRSRHIATVA
jgi:hypothetical protein